MKLQLRPQTAILQPGVWHKQYKKFVFGEPCDFTFQNPSSFLYEREAFYGIDTAIVYESDEDDIEERIQTSWHYRARLGEQTRQICSNDDDHESTANEDSDVDIEDEYIEEFESHGYH